ncbi:hypothetical protein ACULNC_16240 [Shigella flexneri]
MPSNVAARVAVEAGIADYWYKYVGLERGNCRDDGLRGICSGG